MVQPLRPGGYSAPHVPSASATASIYHSSPAQANATANAQAKAHPSAPVSAPRVLTNAHRALTNSHIALTNAHRTLTNAHRAEAFVIPTQGEATLTLPPLY
jgi:hypothetical protein